MPARALAGYKAGSRKIVLGYRVEEGEIVSRSLDFLCVSDCMFTHISSQSSQRGRQSPTTYFTLHDRDHIAQCTLRGSLEPIK